MTERTIANYPFIADEAAAPGRCRHRVRRLGEGTCGRPARHVVGGVGLCRTHHGHFGFWQRGGFVGTPEEMWLHLVEVCGGKPVPFVDGRSGRTTGESVRAPAGWTLSVRRAARVGYAALARHRGLDGAWHYRLEWPIGGRRRASHRSVAGNVMLVLDTTEEVDVE